MALTIEQWVKQCIANTRGTFTSGGDHYFRMAGPWPHELKGTGAAREVFTILAKVFPECQVLEMGSGNVTESWVNNDWLISLAELGYHFTSLNTISFYSTQVDDDGVNVLAEHVKHFPNLERLDFRFTQVGNIGLEALSKQAKHLTKLWHIDFSGTKVDDEGMKVLAKYINNLRGLEALSFGSTKVGSIGLKALAKGAHCLANLRVIDLSDTRVDDDGLKSLVRQAKYLPNLSYLIFHDTPVGDSSLQLLAAQAKHLPKLERLDFDNTQIGDKGLQALAEHSQHLGKLEFLSLCRTFVTNDGLRALSAAASLLTNFKYLFVDNTLATLPISVLSSCESAVIFKYLQEGIDTSDEAWLAADEDQPESSPDEPNQSAEARRDAPSCGPEPAVDETTLYHSPDFRFVIWYGTRYTFTVNQARCVQALWEAAEKGIEVLTSESILKYKLDEDDRKDEDGREDKKRKNPRRLRDTFKKEAGKGTHLAWGTMIVRDEERKGLYKLSRPVPRTPRTPTSD